MTNDGGKQTKQTQQKNVERFFLLKPFHLLIFYLFFFYFAFPTQKNGKKKNWGLPPKIWVFFFPFFLSRFVYCCVSVRRRKKTTFFFSLLIRFHFLFLFFFHDVLGFVNECRVLYSCKEVEAFFFFSVKGFPFFFVVVVLARVSWMTIPQRKKKLWIWEKS